MSEVEVRVCRVCGVEFPLDTAHFDRSSRKRKDGSVYSSFNRTCKRCRYERDTRVALESDTPELYLRAKWVTLCRKRRLGGVEVCPSLWGKKGLPYLMGLWSTQRGLCAVTGVPMTWGRVSREDVSREGYGRAVGIDRIDNARGYIRGNLQLVCSQVNYMRGGLSEEAFLEWCRSVTRGQEPPFC